MSENNSFEIDELWAAFDQDFRENLDLAEEVLLKLESEPADGPLVAALFRAMHTFKGVARMMGLTVLEGLSHRAETLVSLVRDEGVALDEEMTDMLYQVIDLLRNLQVEVLSKRSDVRPEQVEPAQTHLSGLIDSRKPTGQAAAEIQQPPATPNLPTTEVLPVVSTPLETVIVSPPDALPEVEPLDDMVVEHINPACDTTYVEIFLEICGEQIPRIAAALQGLVAGRTEAGDELTAEIDALKLAAEGMGYSDVCTHLDKMLAIEQALVCADAGIPSARTRSLLELQRCKLGLAAELMDIQDCARQIGVERSLDLENFVWPGKQSPLEAQPEAVLLAEDEALYSSTANPASKRVSPELPELMEAVGEMVADQATSHRLLARLTENDLEKSILRRIEIALTEGADIRHELAAFLEEWAHDMDTLYRADVKLGAALSEFQEQVRSLGVCPAADLLEPLEQLVLELSTQAQKEVALTLEGWEVELDQGMVPVLDRVVRLLLQYSIENCIEMPAERESAGKPRQARLSVSLCQRETAVQVTVKDDGAQFDAVRARLEMAEEEQALSMRNSRLQVQNNPEGGLSYTVQVPVDLTVVDGMVVRAGSVLYVVPVNAIQRITVPEQAELARASAGGGDTLVRQADHWLPVYPLSGLESRANGYLGSLVVVIEKEGRQVALAVDELIGRQQVLIRSLSGQLAQVRDAAGCALLGEGEVGMLLDLSAILGRYQCVEMD